MKKAISIAIMLFIVVFISMKAQTPDSCLKIWYGKGASSKFS